MPAQTLEQAGAEARRRGLSGWWLPLDAPTYVDVITHADDRDLRQHFYRAWSTRDAQAAFDIELHATLSAVPAPRLRPGFPARVLHEAFAEQPFAVR